MQGALKFEKAFPESNIVAVIPANKAQLESRLRGRGTETAETIQVRINNAVGEMEAI